MKRIEMFCLTPQIVELAPAEIVDRVLAFPFDHSPVAKAGNLGIRPERREHRHELRSSFGRLLGAVDAASEISRNLGFRLNSGLGGIVLRFAEAKCQTPCRQRGQRAFPL